MTVEPPILCVWLAPDTATSTNLSALPVRLQRVAKQSVDRLPHWELGTSRTFDKGVDLSTEVWRETRGVLLILVLQGAI